jgi:pyruvate dehydrogenase E2 component (dihydrolipoamide acetyltransferase)
MPDVLMPRIDPGMQSGKIVEWLKKEGELVQKGEPILVVEGEKTTFEIEAPESGVLSKILVEVGTDVQVTQPIAIIGESEKSPSPEVQLKPAQQEIPSSPQSIATSPATPGDRVIASPAARRLAQDRGVDIAQILGTGPGGRITREDVLAAAESTSSAPRVVSKVNEPVVLRRVKLDGIRKAVAERLTFSERNVVPVTLTMETDASRLVELKNRGDHVGFTALAVKAVARALESHPAINSTIEGDEVTVYSDINVAVAIDTDLGLVAPVIRNADKSSAKEIDVKVKELSQKAKQSRLTIEELTGGTFTVTNLGAYDVESFAPIINPPQCAILGLGRIAYRPVAAGEQVTTRPTTVLTLVFDHRIVDGVPAAKFLRDVKKNLEDPQQLL